MEVDEGHPATRTEAAAALEELALLAIRHLGSTPEMSFTAAATLGRLDRNGPTRLTVLAIEEGVAQPSMTQLVKRLAAQGLVERVDDPDDGRAVRVGITGEGRSLLAERRRRRAERLADLLADLPEEEERVLTDAARAALPVLRRLVRPPDAGLAGRPGPARRTAERAPGVLASFPRTS